MTNMDEDTEVPSDGKLSKPGDEDTEVPSDGKLSKPAMYMYFSSIEEAENHYREYGKSLGFSIRKRSSYATGRGPRVTRVIFVCGCEGIHVSRPDQDEIELKIKRNTSSMKTDCKAMIRIALDIKHQTWYINEFREDHNHVMVSPKKRHLMRSSKYMPPAAKSLAEKFNKERLPVGKVASLFGESENIGFTPRDVYNHLRTVRQSLIEVGDAEAVMNYFRKRTIENPNFYYAVKTDEVGRAANIFWVDARSRIGYRRFGDAVSFDTTYKTNKYSMPFAPFTGTNHHHQSITFGFALLGDETKETFIWLFETWLEAMGEKNDLVELGKEHGKHVEESGADIEPLAADGLCGEPDQLVLNEEACARSPAKKMGNPIKIQTKGRKSDKEKEIIGGNSRCKSGIEMKRKPRKCKTCGGDNHDSRNCPTKKAEQSSALTDLGT